MFNEPIYLKTVITKQPSDIQGRWQKHAFRYMNNNNVHNPPFVEFVSFVDQMSRKRNDPNLRLNLSGDYQNVEQDRGKSQRTYKTDLTGAHHPGQKGQLPDPSHWCIVHRKPHPLNQCRVFRAKPIEQRKDLLKQHSICYHCVASNSHMAKNCKATIKCDECHSNRHISALHAGRPPKLEVQNRGSTAEWWC